MGSIVITTKEQAILISNIADYFLVTEEFSHYRLELLFQHKVDALSTFHLSDVH